MQGNLEILSAILVPFASIVYAWGVIHKEIDPTKATWIVWTLLSSLTAISMFAESALNYQIIVVAIADIIILFLAFQYGSAWEWTKVDIICLAGAAVSLLLWWATNNALWALIIQLIATVIGFVPMVTLLWERPEVEKLPSWIVMCVSSTLLLLSLKTWTIASAAQPLVYLVIPIIVLFLVLRGRTATA